MGSEPPGAAPLHEGRRRIVVGVAAFIGIAITGSAGVWQWRKAQARHEAQTHMEALAHAAPWSNRDWPCESSAREGSLMPHLPVFLRGRWLADHTIVLDNRPMDGMSGFIVVTPLRLSSMGVACDGRVVLVERGWLPRDPADRRRIPPFATPSEEVRVPGRTAAALSRVYQLGEEPMPAGGGVPLRQNADAAFWSRWLNGEKPLPGVVLQSSPDVVLAAGHSGTATTDTLLRHWSSPGEGGARNMAYAVQWFAMAALIAGLTLWFQFIRPSRHSPHHVPS